MRCVVMRSHHRALLYDGGPDLFTRGLLPAWYKPCYDLPNNIMCRKLYRAVPLVLTLLRSNGHCPCTHVVLDMTALRLGDPLAVLGRVPVRLDEQDVGRHAISSEDDATPCPPRVASSMVVLLMPSMRVPYITKLAVLALLTTFLPAGPAQSSSTSTMNHGSQIPYYWSDSAVYLHDDVAPELSEHVVAHSGLAELPTQMARQLKSMNAYHGRSLVDIRYDLR